MRHHQSGYSSANSNNEGFLECCNDSNKSGIGELINHLMRTISREEFHRLTSSTDQSTQFKDGPLKTFPEVIRSNRLIQPLSTEATTIDTHVDASLDYSSQQQQQQQQQHGTAKKIRLSYSSRDLLPFNNEDVSEENRHHPQSLHGPSHHDTRQQLSHSTTTQHSHPDLTHASLVSESSYPSLENIGTETNHLIRNELRRYCTKTDQKVRVFTSDERIDEIVCQSLPKGFQQYEDLEDFVCIIQRRKILWSRVANWIIKTVAKTWATDLITLSFALEVVIPYWHDRKLFIDTFHEELQQLLLSILNDPMKCVDEGPPSFFASLMIKDSQHNHNNNTSINPWFSYLQSFQFTSKRSHQLTFVHKLLYQFSLADESYYGSELLSLVTSNNDSNECDEEAALSLSCDNPPMLPQSITPDLEFKLLNVINDPLALRKSIDDRNMHAMMTSPSSCSVDDIAKAMISLISRPGYAKSLGEVCKCPKAQLVAKRIREIFKDNLLMLISHSSDCFSRARVIEFLSYLLPSSSEYNPETRELLEQLGRSPPDKRISLWLLLKYLDGTKQDAISAVKEELRRLDHHGMMPTKIDLNPPIQVGQWSFLS